MAALQSPVSRIQTEDCVRLFVFSLIESVRVVKIVVLTARVVVGCRNQLQRIHNSRLDESHAFDGVDGEADSCTNLAKVAPLFVDFDCYAPSQ